MLHVVTSRLPSQFVFDRRSIGPIIVTCSDPSVLSSDSRSASPIMKAGIRRAAAGSSYSVFQRRVELSWVTVHDIAGSWVGASVVWGFNFQRPEKSGRSAAM